MIKFLTIFSLCLITLSCWGRDIVPFTVNPNTNQMEVEVFVNNDSVPFNFVLDTGASAVFANSRNERLMKLLNFCDTDTVDQAFSNAIIKKTAFDNMISIGNLVADSIQIHSADDISTTYDGIIGISLLYNYRFAILADAKMLVFCNDDEPLSLPRALELPLTEWQGVYATTIEMTADTLSCQGTFMLDTGYGGTIAITSQFSDKYELGSKFKQVGTLKSTDAAGFEGETYLVTVPRTYFGGESLPLLPCQLDKDSSHTEYAKFLDGLIGYDILKRYNTIWDFKNSKLYIASNLDFFSPFTFIKHQ